MKRILLTILAIAGLFLFAPQTANGQTVKAPEVIPSLMLVVGDSVTLDANDLGAKTLIESWNYSVTVLDDSATQTEFDAVIAVVDVAFVALSTDQSELADKLLYSTIGVINESTEVRKRLAWPPGGSSYTGETMYVNPDHYITASFPAGDLTLFTSPQPMSPMNPGYAQGFGQVAMDDTDMLLQLVEEGDSLFPSGSGVALSRRVMLPWGDNGFDYSALNPDALTIMRRAITWAKNNADLGRIGIFD